MIGAVAFLIAFALSFATSFLLTNAASRSLDANFADSNYTCSIANMIVDPVNITCYGSSAETQCIRVSLNCDGFNDTKLLYEYYHSYYRKAGSNVCKHYFINCGIYYNNIIVPVRASKSHAVIQYLDYS